MSTNGQTCENCKHFGKPIAESPVCQECIADDWLETARTGGTRLSKWEAVSASPPHGRAAWGG